MKKFAFLILPLLLASLACQAVMGTPQPSPTATPIPLTDTPTPTETPLPTSTPTATPTAVPTATLTSTITPTGSPFQQQVFDELWHTINENYLYEDFNGLDWEAIYDEYNQKIASGLSDADFYAAMKELIDRLGDEHSAFFTPEEAKEEDASYAGDYNFVGIGIMTISVLERQLITIIAVFPGSPAEEAGLQVHDNVLTVDGQPVLDEQGNRRQDLLLGPEGSSMTLTVQTPSQEARPVTLTRRRVTGSLPVFNEVLLSPAGKRIGYLLLATFGDSSVDDQVRQALQTMNEEAPLDGLILDNRVNGGGYSDVVNDIFSLFTSGTLGHFISREGRDPLVVRKKGIAGSQNLPLVVMVGQGTASFGEIFSGVLQDLGRAYLIGEQTEGNVEILYIYEFVDGSRAWIAHDSFRPLNHPEQDWEKSGILPDLVVPSEWDQVTLQSDPAVQAALEYLDR